MEMTMSLTAYLTRQEWIAAYLVGAHGAGSGDLGDLSTHLRRGIVLLHKAGYGFQGVAVHGDAPEDVELVTQIDDAGAAFMLVGRLKGKIDKEGMLREFIAWADEHPTVRIDACVHDVREHLRTRDASRAAATVERRGAEAIEAREARDRWRRAWWIAVGAFVTCVICAAFATIIREMVRTP